MKVTKRQEIPCWPGQTMYTSIAVHDRYMRKADRPHKAADFPFDDIGRCLFFTREEAIAALEKGGGTDG